MVDGEIDPKQVEQAIDVALSLNEAVPALDRRISRTARRMWLIILSVVVDVVLTVVIGQTAVEARHAEQQASASTCNAGNAFRAADKQRWDYLVSLTIPRSQSAAEKALTAKFIHYIDAADEPRKC